MRPNIFSKLFLSMLLMTVLAVLVMVVFTNWSFRTGFTDYQHSVELDKARKVAALVENRYAAQRGWGFLRGNPAVWGELLVQIGERLPPPAPPPRQSPPGMGFSRDLPAYSFPASSAGRGGAYLRPLGVRMNLLDANQQLLAGDPLNLNMPPKGRSKLEKIPVLQSGATIGWVTVRQGRKSADNMGGIFFEQQLHNLYIIGLFVIVLSLLAAALLVRHFLKPVRALMQGTQALTTGQLGAQIEVETEDELGRLAQDFNKLARTLKRQEDMRRQWLADISHELRTPIAILRSEIEAMLDGIRQPTLERIRSLHVDVLSLGKLVDDLHQLSISDSGESELPDVSVNLADILDDALDTVEPHLASKNLRLTRHLELAKPAMIRGDATRLHQLFTNLLANSQRYTDAKGQVDAAITVTNDKVIVEIQDTAPGVPDEALPHLFDRLFRVDKSRSRSLGGSGLGLSICKNIVETHHGTITARHSSLGGVCICMEFPLISA
ncbi:MAG: HAMP domain-containing protein [Gammaproteobacteria bacterium]|nr:HAMP domain-containing protein [Gammaproteobacteria bacterium]MBU1725019.1 HAMP domain-containing protein [Gammaproteobacteria bacterium]MBU2003887.1 HAMP domain-containing protein [Gammaproteobacteria bacterium]